MHLTTTERKICNTYSNKDSDRRDKTPPKAQCDNSDRTKTVVLLPTRNSIDSYLNLSHTLREAF